MLWYLYVSVTRKLLDVASSLFFRKHFEKSIEFGSHGYNPHALKPFIVVSDLIDFSITHFKIGVNLSFVNSDVGLYLLHSITACLQPILRGLNAETSAGCNIRVAFGYRAIITISSSVHTVLISYTSVFCAHQQIK